MNTFHILLQGIRKRPGLYLGNKSLSRLAHFRHGYELRERIEYWEKQTGLSFSEHFYEAVNFTMPASESFLMRLLFDEFVHAHYGQTMGAMCAETLIVTMSNSEDEAFDKYCELYDEFCALEGITIPILPDAPPIKVIDVSSKNV